MLDKLKRPKTVLFLGRFFIRILRVVLWRENPCNAFLRDYGETEGLGEVPVGLTVAEGMVGWGEAAGDVIIGVGETRGDVTGAVGETLGGDTVDEGEGWSVGDVCAGVGEVAGLRAHPTSNVANIKTEMNKRALFFIVKTFRYLKILEINQNV